MRQLITFLLGLSCWVAVAQIGPHEMVQRMGRGINLGNCMSAPIEGNWSPPATEQYFTDIANAGFTNVRIPIRFESWTDETAPYDVADSYLNRVEEVTDWALDKGLVAIIDVHGDKWFWESYKEGTEYYPPTQEKYDRFMSIWTHISERFKSKPENLLFEIMNEAYFAMDADEVDEVNTDVLEIIRNSGGNNATRNVIVTGGGENSWEAPLQLKSSFIESDEYLIATFHYYWPRAFTASADKGDDEDKHQDNDWGTEQDKADVDVNFDAVRAWSLENDIPVFVGEFGADNEGGLDYESGEYGDFGGPDPTSRAAYYGYLSETSLAHGFSFAAWDAGPSSGKTIHLRTDNGTNVISGTWVEDVKDAIINSEDFCIQSNYIQNGGFECDFDEDWTFTTSGIAEATFSNAAADSYQGFAGAKVEVTKQDVIDRVVLASAVFDVDVSENAVTVTCFAKGDAGSTFKLQTTSTVGGLQVTNSSDAFTLTDSYQEFEFMHFLDDEVTDLQVQVLCGAKVGIYYFDDFEVEFVDQTILETPMDREWRLKQKGSYFEIENSEGIERASIFTLDGRIVSDVSLQGRTNFSSSIAEGLHIVRVESRRSIRTFKLIGN